MRRLATVGHPVVVAGFAALVTAMPAGADVSIREGIVQATNAERARAGLAPLRTDGRLMEAAQIQADQMARASRLDHVLPDAPHPTARDRLASVGYRWTAYAENVASGSPSAARTVKNWMSSPGHRANILGKSYEEIGTGYAIDAKGRPYYVEMFGRPLSR